MFRVTTRRRTRPLRREFAILSFCPFLNFPSIPMRFECSERHAILVRVMTSDTRAQSSTAIPVPDLDVSSITRRLPALAVLTLGFVLLYAVGFSTFSVAHNATHD